MKKLLYTLAILFTVLVVKGQTIDTVTYSFHPDGSSTNWQFLTPAIGEEIYGCRIKDFYYLSASPERPALGYCNILYDPLSITDTVNINVFNIYNSVYSTYDTAIAPYPLTHYGRANPLISIECLVYHP